MEVMRYKSEDGCVEIKVSTNNIASCWQRFRGRIKENAATYCDYRCNRPGTLWLTDVENISDETKPVGEGTSTEWLGLPPVFFETNPYSFIICFKGVEGKPAVLHPNREVEAQFNFFGAGENMAFLNGSLDFINEPGVFPLRFRYKPIGAPERTDTLEFRIVSPKLDTKDDYKHILEEIDREYKNLVFKFLTKTFQSFQRKGKVNNELVWLSIFQAIVEDYLKAMEYIVSRPNIRQEDQQRYSRADRIRYWTPQMAEQYHHAERESMLETKLFRHNVSVSTSDTRENRFVKYTIESIGKRLNHILNELLLTFGHELSDDKKEQLRGYQESIVRLRRNKFFKNIGRFEGFKQESIVLQKRTGYAQIYRAWFILNSGLTFYEGLTQIGTRPIWELYELWCFLKMKQLITEIFGLKYDSELIEEEKSAMLDPFKESEVEHVVRFHMGGAIGDIELKYQHTYNRHKDDDGVHTATTEQRPDIVLNIIKPDGFVLTYLYDAKYRVLDDKNANDRDAADADFADYPPSDAINQMHRYRDAIYYGRDKQTHSAKEIIGGYILFPGRVTDTKVRERYYIKSIETVNIGAFPLLPSKNGDEDSLLKEHLTSILLNKTKYQQIKDSVPQRGLSYVSDELASPQDIVLVGYVENKEEKLAIIKNQLYCVPIGSPDRFVKLIPGYESSKYLLLYDSQNNRELYALTGEHPQMISAEEMRNKGFNPISLGYMTFRLRTIIPIIYKGLEINDVVLPAGKQRNIPYFTSMNALKT